MFLTARVSPIFACLFSLMYLTVPLSSNGYRFPNFLFFSIVNCDCQHYGEFLPLSLIFLKHCFSASVSHRPQGGAIRYISPLVAPSADSSFFHKRPFFSSFWGTKRYCDGFLPPHFPAKPWPGRCSLCSEREPSSWLRFLCWAFTAVSFLSTGLGVVAANIHSLASCARFIIRIVVYLLFPMHPCSGYFLRFMEFGKVFHFLALCLGLSTAPQVFTRVMAPV